MRIWDKELTALEIQSWKDKIADSTHPQYTHLKAIGVWRKEQDQQPLMKLQQKQVCLQIWMTIMPGYYPQVRLSCSPEDNKLTQTISFDPPPAKQFADTRFIVQATASSRFTW